MTPRATNRTRSRAGFSLAELALGVSLLGAMTLVAGLAAERCLALLRQQRARLEVSAETGRALQRIVNELAFGGLDALTPRPAAPLDSETVTFRPCTGFDTVSGTSTWGAERTIRLEYESGEADDDLDDDGDGLVDEGVVVLIENEGQAGERRVVLAHAVSELLEGEVENGEDDNGNGLIDEQGLSFVLDGEVLTVRLSLLAPGPDGTVITRTMRTAVFVRN